MRQRTPPLEKVKCMICLEEILERTKMNKCSHFFCFECIHKWAEVTNCCPLCKVPSLSLHTFKISGSKLVISRKTRIKAKTQTNVDENIEFQEFADACYICGDEGSDTELLVCDNCDYKIAHINCLGFASVPEGNWNCQFCEA